MIKAASLSQWPNTVLQHKNKNPGPKSPINHHHKRDICKTIDMTGSFVL